VGGEQPAGERDALAARDTQLFISLSATAALHVDCSRRLVPPHVSLTGTSA
jgi:hypothetical protein